MPQPTPSPGAWNALDPATIEDPFPFFAALRRHEPVYWDPNLECFLVTRYADVWEVIHRPEVFSSQTGPITKLPPMEVLAVLMTGRPPVDTLLSADPPRHTRYRSLVTRAFAPRRVSGLEPAIRSLAHELVDRFAGQGEVELVSGFAVPFPLAIIADQLGVPRSDMPHFKRWSDDFVTFLGQIADPPALVEAARGIVEFQRYMVDRIEERRAGRRDDILSDVVHASLDGVDPLSTDEVLSIAQQFMVAGNETSTNMISAAMLHLCRNEDQMAAVLGDPGLIPNAIEETLRMESPAHVMFRLATRDTEIAGTRLPAGSRIAVVYGSANRDEAKFPDPDRFDVRRENARDHLAFGHGTHYCLGAGLARKEGAVALEVLLSRLRGWRLPPGRNDFLHHPLFILRGLRALHCAFDPA